MLTAALLLGCLMCGDDPAYEFADLPRSGLPYSMRSLPQVDPSTPRPERASLPFVDLSWPGSLERLARENPEHALKAREILEAAAPLSCESLLAQLRARSDLAEPTCVTRSLLSTDPPRRIVGFTLGDTKYLSWLK